MLRDVGVKSWPWDGQQSIRGLGLLGSMSSIGHLYGILVVVAKAFILRKDVKRTHVTMRLDYV